MLLKKSVRGQIEEDVYYVVMPYEAVLLLLLHTGERVIHHNVISVAIGKASALDMIPNLVSIIRELCYFETLKFVILCFWLYVK
ncbi:hypothetical protein MIDIC_490024 [Alphaproteobacteria bacterium]